MKNILFRLTEEQSALIEQVKQATGQKQATTAVLEALRYYVRYKNERWTLMRERDQAQKELEEIKALIRGLDAQQSRLKSMVSRTAD